eukprot:8210785-Pyramimonas_sp.AAC.1
MEGEVRARQGHLQFCHQGISRATSPPDVASYFHAVYSEPLQARLCEKRTAMLEPDTTSHAPGPAGAREKREGEGRA